MSLYFTQKFMYELNRSVTLQEQFSADAQGALAAFDPDGDRLTATEREALATADVGLLYHLGSNGQILMHYAAFCGIEWPDYLQMMRDGLAEHGPVREGVYAMVGYAGVDSVNAITEGPSSEGPSSERAA